MGSWRVVPAQTYLLPCNVGDRKLPVSGALGWKERRMTRRHWSRSRKVKIGSALIVLGMMVWALSAALLMVWALSAALPLTARSDPDVSISYFEGRSIGVIAGGGSVLVGIVLLATVV